MTFFGKAWACAALSGRRVAILGIAMLWIFGLSVACVMLVFGLGTNWRLPSIAISVEDGLPALPDPTTLASIVAIVPLGTTADAVLRISVAKEGRLLVGDLEEVATVPKGWLLDGPVSSLKRRIDRGRLAGIDRVAYRVLNHVKRAWVRDLERASDKPAWLSARTTYVYDGVPLEETSDPLDGSPKPAAAARSASFGAAAYGGLVALRAIAAGIAAANAVALSMAFSRRKGHYEALLATDVDVPHLVFGHLLIMAAGIAAGATIACSVLLGLSLAGGEAADEWAMLASECVRLSLVAVLIGWIAMPFVLVAQLKPRRRRWKIAAAVGSSLALGCLLSLPAIAIHLLDRMGFVVGLTCMALPDGWPRFALCTAAPFVAWLPMSGFAAWLAGISHDGTGAAMSLLLGVPCTALSYLAATRIVRRPDMLVQD